MLIKKTIFKGLLIIKKKKFVDNRGFFYRDYCEKELKKIKFQIKQTNISFNKNKFTLRGFHSQLQPNSESKIISCISGEIINICIDLRKNSKTYLKFYRKILNDKNNISLLVPRGFANAYLTLKKNTKIFYYMSSFYKPSKEKNIRWNDKFFSIKWPHKPKHLSKKDSLIPDFKP
tara:strand:- start:25279 stop:25803 length:525 start_codon:yes stop_codon:yes gene_type:complete